ncbi:MAG: hypothetical protein HN929_08775 [Chloroflexi bacterium]|jgi:hypothetical protein|nr:hypothetical protein [Chloroflexota bacterium]MBT7081543.1 hypothetical protein [Chloroflexota bacterium]MBT7289364.1 hypothetical protein [Chloroflexota bacterium]
MATFKPGQKVKVVDGCSPYYGRIGEVIKEGDGYFGCGYHVEFMRDEADLLESWLFQEFQLGQV